MPSRRRASPPRRRTRGGGKGRLGGNNVRCVICSSMAFTPPPNTPSPRAGTETLQKLAGAVGAPRVPSEPPSKRVRVHARRVVGVRRREVRLAVVRTIQTIDGCRTRVWRPGTPQTIEGRAGPAARATDAVPRVLRRPREPAAEVPRAIGQPRSEECRRRAHSSERVSINNDPSHIRAAS